MMPMRARRASMSRRSVRSVVAGSGPLRARRDLRTDTRPTSRTGAVDPASVWRAFFSDGLDVDIAVYREADDAAPEGPREAEVRRERSGARVPDAHARLLGKDRLDVVALWLGSGGEERAFVVEAERCRVGEARRDGGVLGGGGP